MLRSFIRLLATTPKSKSPTASTPSAASKVNVNESSATTNNISKTQTDKKKTNFFSDKNVNENSDASFANGTFGSKNSSSGTMGSGNHFDGSNTSSSTNNMDSNNFSSEINNNFTPNKEIIPDVMVTFGVRMNQITFVSHPGVMAVSKLLEMHSFTTTKTTLTQENVDAIKEFDEELAVKAQIAVDNDLSINFADMEYLDKPDVLEMFLNEKYALEKISKDVMSMAPNDYTFPESMKEYKKPEIPKAYRPELLKEQEMLESTPEGKEYLALHKAAEEFIEKTVIPDSSASKLPHSSQKKIE